ncbi:arg8-vasotocin receptor-like [Physella acuta]|uniref:arg8-vasotocin receptor-like n=1 Tax=Physella acuta TaxID=109671 RepID=UPI0027DC9D2B|nr:arg8-vasotocin receptor-like [Physella acuta]
MSNLEGDELEAIPLMTSQLFELICSDVVNGVICLFGVAFNVVNMIVFIKQGFKDYMNISLLSLSVADTLALLSQLWTCFNIKTLVQEALSHWYAVVYLASSWPHVISIRVISLLIVFITLERYLCISLPLKIKSIITHKRTIVIIGFVYLFSILTAIPIYFACYVGPVIDNETNISTMGLVYTEDGYRIESAILSFGITAQLTSFIIVVILTIALVQKFIQTTKWRLSTSSATMHDHVTKRDKSAVKMIILISTIYIVCYTPYFLLSLAMACVKDFGATGKYQRLFNITTSLMFTADSINSAVSIFVYYKMSTKYRNVFFSLLKGFSKTRMTKS